MRIEKPSAHRMTAGGKAAMILTTLMVLGVIAHGDVLESLDERWRFQGGERISASRINDNFDTLASRLGADSLGAHGLALDYADGRLKVICGAEQCSEDNRGYVVMPSADDSNRLVSLGVWREHFFTDGRHDSSDIAGQPFGTTPGVAWTEARPFFIYAVNPSNDDADLLFGVSPRPNMTSAPGELSIGRHGLPMPSPSDNGLFLLTHREDGPAVAEGAPVLRIGSFVMHKDSSDDWLIGDPRRDDARLRSHEGISRYINETTAFRFPPGQMASGRTQPEGGHLAADSGHTPPSWPNAEIYEYELQLNGRVHIWFRPTGNVVNGHLNPDESWRRTNLGLALPYAAPSRSPHNTRFFTCGSYVYSMEYADLVPGPQQLNDAPWRYPRSGPMTCELNSRSSVLILKGTFAYSIPVHAFVVPTDYVSVKFNYSPFVQF